MNTSIEQRIARITANLTPQTAFDGKYDPPQTIQERIAKYHTPGVSVAVINDFEIEWAQGFGVCEAGSSNEITPSTLFQAGSISKPVFALAIMRLVQEGRINLDEDVNTYLTSWKVPSNDDWQPRITLRQLLSHSAGLTVHGFPGYQVSERIPTVVQLLKGEMPANTAKVEVNILPGVQARYSGGGTTVGQLAIADFLGQSFPELMRSLVLDPLGMRNSTYEQPLPADWATRAATAHPWKGNPLAGKHHIYPEMAAAGLWTTATDLAHVGVELLQVLHGKKQPALLTAGTIEAMLSPQVPGHKVGGEYIGIGFFNQGEDDSHSFGHGGWDEGFVADMRIFKNLGKGAIVMVNSNEGHPLMGEIMRAIAQEYEWPDTSLKPTTAAPLVNTTNYLGTYTSESESQFHIVPLNEGIALQFANQPPLALIPTSETEFAASALNTKITFEKSDSGSIIALVLSQAGNRLKAMKQN